MKLSKIFVAILAICAFVACKPDNGNGGGGNDKEWSNSGSPVGEWVLSEWNDSAELPFGVYLRLNEDDSFDLYQHTYNVLWVHYAGTFSLNGNTLSGVYSDGESWAEYTIQYNEKSEPKQIKLSRKDSEDVAIYTATEIPAEVTDNASDAIEVRSVEIQRFL